jgi:diguanylate cyclase (GGDEF)-like protein
MRLNEGYQPSPKNKRTFSPLRSSIRIAGIYCIIGCLWVLLTDRAVSAFTQNIELIELINMLKGWFFVVLTAVLIFLLILDTLKRIKKIETKLAVAYKDKIYAHESLESAYEEIIATEDELRQQYDRLIENQRMLTESEEEMHHLAYHDVLTGLPNKLALYENGSNTILPDADIIAALMFVDIDNFKYINDTMGHDFGDRLIVKASERLLSIVDKRGDVYRFGGDEFIILLHPMEDTEEINNVAALILAGFKGAVEIDNSLLHISISIGISIYPDHGNDIMELVKSADIAMYKAKEAGKSSSAIFDHPLNDTFIERMNIEKHLYKAMEQDEFELVYQPQVDLSLNKVTGLEALLRWNSPELGFVSPLKFIKVAEDSHLIIPLGAWVLRTACAFLKSLHDQGLTHLTMSVNISMLQIVQTDFNELVLDTLHTCGIKPEYLELELTETVLVESYDHVLSRLNELRAHNIKIALDDFGTGYSSLSYLTHLPITTLKIDKSFIDSIRSGTHQEALIEQIIIIGKKMNMCVIAEGVEQTVQLEYLQTQGCDKIQGYLFSKPQSAQNVEQLLLQWENTGIGTPVELQY